MTQQEAINLWVESAEEDWKTAKILFDNKRYSYCLFFCHLTVEKLLKAIIIKVTDEAAMPSHDLIKLAATGKIELSSKMTTDFKEMNSFNIEARYDVYKQLLYQKATPAYTKEYLAKTERIRLWLIKQT